MLSQILKYSVKTMSVCLLATAPLLGGSCSDDDVPATDYNWNISGNTIVDIKPERYKLLRNPMTGWVIYSGIGDGMMMNFWDLYDNFESSEGTVKVSEYGNTLYVRGLWSHFNPEPGKYVWDESVTTEPAKRFRMLVEGAKERNLKLAFTFVCDSRDKHENACPDYVQEAGAQGFTTRTGSVDVWTPYPDDPIFQEKYEGFLTDFAAKYNDPDVTQFVSGFGLGKWGETHTLVYSTGDETPKFAVFEWITDVMSRLFTKVPIMINYHRCILGTKGFDSANLTDAEEMVRRAVAKGFCLRHDAFGMKQYYKDWERGITSTYHGIVPFTMEGGWVESSHGGSIAGDGYKNFAEVRQGEYDEAKGGYVNMMDLRFATNVNTGETHSWFNTAFHLVKEFISEGAYRIYPDRLSVPTTAKSGSSVSLTHRWSNLGWGYCPANLPQYGDKYKLAVALLDKSSGEPVKVYVEEKADIASWLKGSPKTYTSNITLTDVASGTYTWAVGLVDTTKENSIGILLSARDEYQTANGWVKVKDVTIE